MSVHPTAVITGDVRLGPGATIGPWCVVRGPVTLGEGVELAANVQVQGPVTIGPRTRVYPFACIGFEPQDYKFKPGSPTAGVTIGADCLIREHVTIHAASKPDRPTIVGDRCFLMVGSHMGHDARLHDGVILVNSVLLAGHTEVFANATVSGGAVLHQFNRIGRLAMVSGNTTLAADVPPFCMAWGRNSLAGLNLVGMRRAGIPRDEITGVREAFREVVRAGRLTRPEMVERLTSLGRGTPLVLEMAEFIAAAKRPICTFQSQPSIDESEL